MCNLTPSRAEGRGGEQWQALEPMGTTEVMQIIGNSNWGKAKDRIYLMFILQLSALLLG